MEKGFHNIEQFIAFITPGHTAFHERLSIGVYRRGIDGVLDEDLYQELSIILLKAISLFRI